MNREEYARAYAEGYAAGLSAVKNERPSPILKVDGIMSRYEVGINKARQILQAIRHTCNGGKLDSAGAVLVSEAEYWEKLVDAQFKERL